MSFGNQVAYMDLYIFKGHKFYKTGKLSSEVCQIPKNRSMQILFKSTPERRTIKTMS